MAIMEELGASPYTPSPWQQAFHNLPYDEVLGAGAAGPGKSICLLMDPLAQIATEHARAFDHRHPHRIAPGNSLGWALHLRRALTMLDETLARAARVFPQIDPGVRFDAQRLTYHFSSGYRYQFGHCFENDDWERYQSSQYTRILFDELVQFTETQYEQIRSRLRSSDPLLKLMLGVRSMSNPMMRKKSSEQFSVNDPQWVKRRFVTPAPSGKVVLKKKLKLKSGDKWHTWMYFPATLYDNPDPDFVESYEKNLASLPVHIQNALRYGSWEITEGSYYGGDWRESLHVCEPFDIPPHWPVFRSMDWGFKQPGQVGWWAMDDDDTLFNFREWRFKELTDIDAAKKIREIEKGMGLWVNNKSAITGPADTQLWEKRGDTAKSKAQVFQEMGVPWRQADKRSRQRNAELLSGRLKDHSNGTKPPGIVFFNTCRHAIATIPAIQTNQNNVDEPQDGGDDHAHDEVLYACAYASHGRSNLGERKREVQDEDDYERDLEDAVRRGRYGYGSEV